MRKMLRVALAACVAVSLCRAADFSTRADEMVRAYAEKDDFSGAVLVAKDGTVLFEKAYGMANRELEVPNTTKTKFRLGSVTKQFTAMAILQLEEKGKLSVSDPVCKYVPDCPAAWQKMTIHHLLTHTAGIPNFTSFPDYLRTMALPSPVNQTVARFRDKPLEFGPGEKFRYSNSGYVLLGQIIEKVAVESYGAYVRKHIFEPLGMNDSGYESATEILPRRAAGYARQAGRFRNALYIDMSIPHAAGGLYSTVEDLYLWSQSLDTEKLVSRKSLQRMFTPYKEDYAYGWFIRAKGTPPAVEHGGGINGFASFVARYPAERAFVVVLANMETGAGAKIAHPLGKMLFGK